jgi:replicative DNA helicase
MIRGNLKTLREFAYPKPYTGVALWGRDDEVLWAAGEPLWIAGPTGTGKTTLAQQLVIARLGLLNVVLGYPVLSSPGRVLYVMSNRPVQAKESFRRMISEQDAAMLKDRLVGLEQLDLDELGTSTTALLAIAQRARAETIVIDDTLAVRTIMKPGGLTTLVAGARRCAEERIQVLCIAQGPKARRMPAFVRRLTAGEGIGSGTGTTAELDGAPGDLVLPLTFWNLPAQDVGPLTIEHDHLRGVTRVLDEPRRQSTVSGRTGRSHGVGR